MLKFMSDPRTQAFLAGVNFMGGLLALARGDVWMGIALLGLSGMCLLTMPGNK